MPTMDKEKLHDAENSDKNRQWYLRTLGEHNAVKNREKIIKNKNREAELQG